ncbi:hypothetical protein [Algoriphagus sp. NG3]|uniref:hypothetical protein n=1 Tax=Algoriphagus sp. NG3 TaxID=3097546 RepID=UPI002A81C95F|nr:hypothetical protein [Algoriphagus sp. NG3]WPR77689.1 hypothetical protein SLW71_10075 [Algoriphagus sp. NG3]
MDYLTKMKEDLDQLVSGLDACYDKIKLYGDFKKAQKNKVLKPIQEVEKSSRYIMEGFVGLFYDTEKGPVLAEIFQATDLAFDVNSYLKEKKTDQYIQCLSDVVYFELSKELEQLLLRHFPDLQQLAIKVNQRMSKRLILRNRIKRMEKEDAYREFLDYMPGIEEHLSQAKIASYFSCSPRTMRIIQQKIKN